MPPDEGLRSWEIGTPVILGSEEALPGLATRLFGESRTFGWRGAPQAPKRPALGPLPVSYTHLRAHET